MDELADHIGDMSFAGLIDFPTVAHYPKVVLAALGAGETTDQQLLISIFGRALAGLAARDDIAAIALRGFDTIPLKRQARIALHVERGRFTPIGERRPVHSGKRLFLIADAPPKALLAEGRIDPDLA